MRRRLLIVALVLAACITPFRRELYVGDETKYSKVVREMRAGSFFLPTLEGSPFTHKPPLHFWMMDALTYPFGVYSVWPFVLPSLAAFALLLWLLWRWGGPMAAFVCGSSLMIWGSAQTARMDVGFTALLALAAFFLERFFADDDFGALWRAAIAVGLATLLKGPMAPVMMIALLLFEGWRRRRLPRGNYLPAILILIATPLLWFVPAVIAGGEAFWREIFYKQTVGRAVGAWVHKSPPWFYVTHAPGTLFPWFFLLVAALVRLYRRSAAEDERPASPAIRVHSAAELIAARHDPRFYVSWILAVLVPYSLLSSKLDVYMMAMIPPVALLIGHYLAVTNEDRWGRRANAFVQALFVVIGAAGATVAARFVKDAADRALAESWPVRGLFVVMAVGGAIGFIVALRARLTTSTVAVGATLIATLAYVGLVLTPTANELATTRPLVRAVTALRIPPEQIALHACPHLWIRGMSPELERVRYVDAADLATADPAAIVTSRKHGGAIAPVLARYRKTGEFRMIGKWFDVYTR